MRTAIAMILLAASTPALSQDANVQTVTLDNFVRAETDTYFARMVEGVGIGKFDHMRELTPIDKQTVVRSNRDTLYSSAVFDLDAGPVTVTLPDAGGRFRSLLAINEDHYALQTIYDGGSHRFTREAAGTRYLLLLVRTFVDPNSPADLKAAHALQDAIRVEQQSPGRFEIPKWDKASLTKTRDAINEMTDFDIRRAFGTREEVDPRSHLIGTARGWGGNPPKDATYVAGKPDANDGKTVYRLTVRDVPVDGFWSVSVYDEDGFFAPNPQNAYSLNNVTAAKDSDGSYAIQFGGCGGGVRNCLPITPGWNYTVRLYRPRAEVLDGRWKFPEPQPR
ncbi:DUF1254 domain-containing protein [Sphingomonas sp. LaA6.9]|uniref:DUF1254 domain-containing protein n=1 Tax=Sphingomonas sp. LaA6.9 TaxID=2919914 RepID=UPI001F4FAAA2|nr:DUF1254 domain-containing protein [Sphingomonas sp. LaA6.9]MCJ8158319.1 DUF1254 domain-containing protein [Sphingomonas sp. LaA6.9]